ncbi:unnamed protein product [Camellia sinensis]
MPNVFPRRSTRIRGPPKSLSLGDFVGPWQGPSNVNKRGLRDVDSEDSSIECDCDLGTTQFRWTVKMQASPEQSPKQHQTPNAWNTPTRVLTDVEQWPKLTTVMMLSNKFGSLSADQRKEVMGSKQRESDKPVRACRNEDSVDLHMEDGSEGLDTLAISGKPLQVGSSLIKEEINKVSKLKYKIGAHKIENQVDGIYNSDEKECDKLVKNGFNDYGCEWDTCVDLCEDSFEDYRDVQVLAATCLSDSHNCLCHIRSKTMCDDDHLLFPPPSSPSPSLSLDNNGGGGGGGGGGGREGLNFKLK